jgi:hypothetical protein
MRAGSSRRHGQIGDPGGPCRAEIFRPPSILRNWILGIIPGLNLFGDGPRDLVDPKMQGIATGARPS